MHPLLLARPTVHWLAQSKPTSKRSVEDDTRAVVPRKIQVEYVTEPSFLLSQLEAP
jgi:hypothetical protein